jgi:Protein of unknown function (DUF1524)
MRRARSKWEIRLTTFLIAGAMALPLTPAEAADQKASVLLETLLVKGRAPKTGYDRSSWGDWVDPDGNGCDTRNDILKRDLTSITYKYANEKCTVMTGILIDPYSGTRIDFLRGVRTSSEIQIDHVVAVSDAWQKGAFKWADTTKVAFYNDPLNLLAVQGKLNSQKGDGDAATWLPPLKSYRCAYVARQIAVKAKYSIWITAAEKAAMKTILAKCPGELLPKG